MKHIKNYNSHLEEQRINEIINYLDLSINESNDLKRVWSNTLSKLKNLSKDSKKRVLRYTFYSLLAFNTVLNISNLIKQTPDNDIKELAMEVLDEIEDSDVLEGEIEDEKEDIIEYKSGYDWILSQSGWDHIRKEEGLRLSAYKLGDGMITIGYGHAEPKKTSKYKVGQEITKKEADDLLKKDLKVAADGVRRMFKQWEENENIDIKITQSMFDALVSIAYNSGVSGLRRSEISKKLKKSDYKGAAESILDFKTNKKFPGLSKRRKREKEMFITGI